MRLYDYIRLGSASILAHKKRSFMIVIIVGIIFSLCFMAYFFLQGAENLAYEALTRPTGGKILVSVADKGGYEGSYSHGAREQEFRRIITVFNGQTIETASIATSDGLLTVLPPEILTPAIRADLDKVPTGAIPALIPAQLLASWQNIEIFPEASQYSVDKATAVAKATLRLKELLQSSLGRVVESPSGIKYYVAGFLPSNVGSSMSLTSVMRKSNAWLDSILTPIASGASPLILLKNDNLVYLDIPDDMEVQSEKLIFASFSNFQDAYSFYQQATSDNIAVEALFGDIFVTKLRYSAIEQLLNRFSWVLAAIAVIVIIVTYLRIIGQDCKNIALYFTAGATRWQIRLVYCIQLLIISLLAILFALCLSGVIAVLINLKYQTPLSQLFALNFGIMPTKTMLFGWSGAILKYLILILAMAPVCILLGQGNFSPRKPNRQLRL